MQFAKVFSVASLTLATLLVAPYVNAANAEPNISLGVASGYNVFIFDDYYSSNKGWNSIGGALAVGGDANISSSGIANSAANAYGLVVGGDLTKSYDGINGQSWVGGSITKPQWDSYSNYVSGPAPIDFAAAKASLTKLSGDLSAVADTGTSGIKDIYNPNVKVFTGSGADVEFFSLDASQFSSFNTIQFSNVQSDATLIFNLSGSFAELGSQWGAFTGTNYNVLLNFYEATEVRVGSVYLSASILAPNAVITNYWGGDVQGTVVANSWNNSLTLHNDAFTGVNSPLLTTPVPEPKTSGMLAVGLMLMLMVTRRQSVKVNV